MKDQYIVYHNYDALDYTPKAKDEMMSFFTKKKLIKNAIGGECYIIVGMGGKKKQYYLWSCQTIVTVEPEDDEYIGTGPAVIFKKSIPLNDVPGFSEFKAFCGNFGLGFQNINNSQFKDTLIALVKQKSIEKGIANETRQ